MAHSKQKNDFSKLVWKLIFSLFWAWKHKTWKPQSDGSISGIVLKTLLLSKFKTKHIFISDDKYMLPTDKTIKDFLQQDDVNFRKYVPTKYDCDNFSFSLMGRASFLLSGYAIGIVWAKTPKGNHALNFYINDSGVFKYIEPQTDRVFFDKDYEPFLLVI